MDNSWSGVQYNYKMKEKKDTNIMFCPSCNWKLASDFDDKKKTDRCPKCKAWTYEIGQFYHYKADKLIAEEFIFGDNDEMGWHSNNWREAKRVIDKGFKLLEKELKK